MIIVNKNAKPKNTIYYISACILSELKLKKNISDLEVFYNDVCLKYNLDIKHDNFIYALDFLYLIKKVDYNSKEEFIYVN